jgi:hypothetical protein
MNLHGQIMNLRADRPSETEVGKSIDKAFKAGHREARHAAAELAVKADACIEAARAVMEFRHDISTTGYIRDNDKSRDALLKLADALAAMAKP